MPTLLRFFSILLFTTLPFQHIICQNTSIVSAGNTINNFGSISYTVGQLFNNNHSADGIDIIQTIQFPIELNSTLTTSTLNLDIQVSVYPNPSKKNIVLNVQNYSTNNLNYKLYNAKGQLLSIQKINTANTYINLQALASAMYYLKIYAHNQLIQTFKIIKV